MANPATPAGPALAGPAARPNEESPWNNIISIAKQMFMVWVVMQVATRFFNSKTTPEQPPAAVPTPDQAATGPPAGSPPATSVLQQAYPAWPLGIPLSMHVYLTTGQTAQVFAKDNNGLPHFVWDNITFGDWNDQRSVDFDINLPYSVQHNGSMWADIFLCRDGADPNPVSPKFDWNSVHHGRKLLTPYLPKIKVRKVKNLLSSGDSAETEEPEEEADVIVSHWHRNLTLALVSDTAVIPTSQMPAPVAQFITLLPERDQTGTKGYYRPIIFPNDFWHLRSQYVEINTTTPTLPLQVTFQPMTYWKFQLFATMTHSFSEAAKQQGASGAEMDEIKRMLVETNPFFLALTAFVSILHVVFEMLAFSSDVSHWRKKQELVGVSVRTIVANVVVQIIILLYLIDNNEQTSWMILMGSGIGTLIEAWKITKAVDISVVPSSPGSRLPYKLLIKDKHVLNEDEKKTQEYDKLAFRYVAWVTIPCLAAYSVYSLLYETHRGWYSFVISTLTSFVYMFGFAQLVPQLIINYKLKSVAHMPMKAMIYKTLSTVVDDLFAFCIKMPVLHRLACFRDDVVFLVFLYQRWIYRIDPKRVNEYGQVMSTDADTVAEKEGKGAKETKKNK